MKTMKNLFLLILTISIFSCSDDDAPPCVPQTWYADADGDSLGDPNASIEQCEQPEGYVGNSNDSDDTDPLNLDPIVSETVVNLFATVVGGQGGPSSGEFTKFDFSTGTETDSETDWDIAFRATTILINGGGQFGYTDEPTRSGNAGAYIYNGTIESLSAVDTNSFEQDATGDLAIETGSGNGWYNYCQPGTGCSPTGVSSLNNIIVVRTRDNKYAKVKIISYYKDGDNTSDSRYYTFDYVYQPNDGLETF
jgi:hypothetical protein